MFRKISGKDGLNKWVKILRRIGWKNWLENGWKKYSGKCLWTSLVDKLGDKNGWKNCVEKLCEKLCEKIRWKIV